MLAEIVFEVYKLFLKNSLLYNTVLLENVNQRGLLRVHYYNK